MKNYLAGDLSELTRRLAFENWERRGCPLGSPQIDWSAAEKALTPSHAHLEEDFSLCSLRMEANEQSYR
jgi:Protein of unknown function (DUF2934)